MMVGRAIEDIYPPLPPHTNQTVFAAEKLSSAGVFEDISFEIHAGEIFGFAGMMGRAGQKWHAVFLEWIRMIPAKFSLMGRKENFIRFVRQSEVVLQ